MSTQYQYINHNHLPYPSMYDERGRTILAGVVEGQPLKAGLVTISPTTTQLSEEVNKQPVK
jgi:hypothetical protein